MVGRQTLVFEQVRANLAQVRLVLAGAETLVDPGHHFFVGLALPHAVAAHEHEVQVRGHLVLVGVGVGRDGLLLGREVQLLLVFQVAERARQVQVAVDAAVNDLRPALGDSVYFNLALRLVVKTERRALATRAHHAATVSRVGHEELLLRVVDHHHVGSAANAVELQVVVPLVLLALVLVLDGLGEDLHDWRLGGGVGLLHLCDFSQTTGIKALVYLQETATHSLLELSLAEAIFLRQKAGVVLLGVSGDLTPAMTVEDGEERLVFLKGEVRNLCVLLHSTI